MPTLVKLCIATVTRNFKWVENTDIRFILEQTMANIDV